MRRHLSMNTTRNKQNIIEQKRGYLESINETSNSTSMKITI